MPCRSQKEAAVEHTSIQSFTALQNRTMETVTEHEGLDQAEPQCKISSFSTHFVSPLLQCRQHSVQYEELPGGLHQLFINLHGGQQNVGLSESKIPPSSTETQVRVGHLELLCGRVQRVLHEVGVVTASLQQHENVLELKVDLGIQWALDIQHMTGAAGDQRKVSDTDWGCQLEYNLNC